MINNCGITEGGGPAVILAFVFVFVFVFVIVFVFVFVFAFVFVFVFVFDAALPRILHDVHPLMVERLRKCPGLVDSW